MTFANGLLIVTETSGASRSASYKKGGGEADGGMCSLHCASAASIACEEELEPIPQITCSLIQASRCSIDTIVCTLGPNALIINCNRRGKQGDQHRSVKRTMFTPLSCVTPTTHIYIIYIILNCVILPAEEKHYFCIDMATNSGQTVS